MGTLFIEARTVVVAGFSGLHSYIVYRDDAGLEWVVGGTSGGPGGGIAGTIDVYYDLLLAASPDARGGDTPADRGQVELGFPAGVDADDVYQLLLQLAAQIEAQAISYEVSSANSNSVTATLLQLVGLAYADVAPTPPGTTDYGAIGSDTVFGFGRSITGTAGADVIAGAEGNDSLTGAAGEDSLSGGIGNDRLDGGDGADALLGEAGADLLRGGIGDDTLDGGAGRDRLVGDAGDDLILGGDQNDTALGSAGNDTLEGGLGDDTLRGNGDHDLVSGGAGNDLVIGGTGRDTLNGDAGADTLRGNGGFDTVDGGTGNDSVFGGSQADLVLGGDGDDTLSAGGGFDTLDGGLGDDVLTGNFNADRFVFWDGHGNDTITDFEATNNAEKIDLSGLSVLNDLAAVMGAASQVGLDVVIDTGGGNSITLLGVSLSDLDASDFLF